MTDTIETISNVHHETAIISAVMIEKDHLDYLKTQDVTPDFFTDPFLREVYGKMIDFSKQGIGPDLPALLVAFPEDQNNLFDIQSYITSAAEIESWVKLLKLKYARQILNTACSTVANNEKFATLEADQKKLTDTLDKVSHLTSGRKETTLDSAFQEYLESISRQSVDRVYWFDPHTEVRQKLIQYRGEMVVIAAESGKGKTELAANFVYQNLKEGRKGIYVCTESSSSQILARITSQFAEVSHQLLQMDNPQEDKKTKFLETMKKIKDDYKDQLKICGSETGVNSADKIRAEVKNFIARHGKCDFLIVDYIQNLQTSHIQNATEYQSITYSTNKIREMLSEFHIAGVVLSQFNRKLEKDEAPTMHNLRGSSALENDPHVVCTLNHTVKYGYELVTAKVRNISEFRLKLTWCGWTYKSKIMYDPNEETY